MAELAGKNGTYVKITSMVWWDKSGKRVHVTSNDPDIPNNGMHMSAKPGTMTDRNLCDLLDKFGCGPNSIDLPETPVAEQLQEIADMLKKAVDKGDLLELDPLFEELKAKITEVKG